MIKIKFIFTSLQKFFLRKGDVARLATAIIIRHGCYIRTFERRVDRLSFISKDNRCFSIFPPPFCFSRKLRFSLSTHFKSNKWNPSVELTSIIRINSTVMANYKNGSLHEIKRTVRFLTLNGKNNAVLQIVPQVLCFYY